MTKVVGVCAGCGNEIEEFTDVYVVDGRLLHANLNCLRLYVEPVYYATATEALLDLYEEIDKNDNKFKRWKQIR